MSVVSGPLVAKVDGERFVSLHGRSHRHRAGGQSANDRPCAVGAGDIQGTEEALVNFTICTSSLAGLKSSGCRTAQEQAAHQEVRKTHIGGSCIKRVTVVV